MARMVGSFDDAFPSQFGVLEVQDRLKPVHQRACAEGLVYRL